MRRITFNKFNNMKVNEVRELLHNLDVAFSECETIKTEMSFAYNPWRTAYQDMVAAYDTSYKSPESDEIHTLDQMIDNLLASGHGAANGLSKSSDAEMAAAARVILQAYKSFKVNYSSNYISQKPQVDSLLYALLVTNRDSVEICGLLPIYERVKQCNDRMHELVELRDQTSYDPQRTAKRETAIARCLDLFDYINGYWLVVLHMTNVPADLQQFFTTSDNIFKRYDRVLGLGSSNSGGSSTNTPGEEEEVEEEEEETEEEETEQQPGGGGSTTERYTITYMHDNQVYTTQQVEVGAQVTPPEPPEGYIWLNVPNRMPARNVTCESYEAGDPNDI